MAKFNSYLLGKVTKSVGNVTMCYMNKQNIARARIFSRKDKPTSEMLDQRARMKVLIELSRFLLPVIRKGFIGIGSGTTSNAFVSLNLGATSADESYMVTIDFARLRMASGLMYTPKVTVTYSEENKMYSFEQEMQMAEEGYSSADDQVYAVLYETVLKRGKLILLRARGENGNTSESLPEEWDSTNVKGYAFATTKNGKAASDSVCLTIA